MSTQTPFVRPEDVYAAFDGTLTRRRLRQLGRAAPAPGTAPVVRPAPAPAVRPRWQRVATYQPPPRPRFRRRQPDMVGMSFDQVVDVPSLPVPRRAPWRGVAGVAAVLAAAALSFGTVSALEANGIDGLVRESVPALDLGPW